ncbi:MAG: hypothetical protein ACKOHG_16825, partial [Planctomycetia bacterium]
MLEKFLDLHRVLAGGLAVSLMTLVSLITLMSLMTRISPSLRGHQALDHLAEAVGFLRHGGG